MTHVSKCFYLLTSFNLTSSQPSNKKVLLKKWPPLGGSRSSIQADLFN